MSYSKVTDCTLNQYLTSGYSYAIRVFGRVPATLPQHTSGLELKAPILTSVTAEIFFNGDDAGFNDRCATITAHSDGRYVVQSFGIDTGDLARLCIHFNHARVFNSTDAGDYLENYQGFFDVDVNECGLLIFFSDICEIN